MLRFCFFLSCFCLVFLSLPTPVHAAVLLNELHPQPTSGNDWFELYNTGPEAVDLEDWLVEDQLGSVSSIKTFSASTLFPAYSYLVVEVGTKLNNSGDGATLKQPDGTIVDQFSYTAAQVGKSWARVPDANGTWGLTDPTPGAPNSVSDQSSPTPSPSSSPTPSPSPSPTPQPTPTPTPSPSPISYPFQFSEVLSCPPTGQTEWLELFNSSDQEFSLENWLIIDRNNMARVVSGVIPAHGYGLLTWSGSLLNNTGDSFQLVSDTGETILETTTPVCQAGQSLVWTNSTWRLSASPTPGATNSLPSSSPTPNPTTSPSPEMPDTFSWNETAELEPPPSATPRATSHRPPATIPTASAAALLTQPSPQPTTPTPNSQQISSPLSPAASLSVIMGGGLLLTASALFTYDHICTTRNAASPSTSAYSPATDFA